MTTISINQPAYLPWLGYFNRILKSDLHIVLDHVQFEKNSFINRNKILLNERPVWLTLPVQTKGLSERLWINELRIDQKILWQKKHWKTIEQAYAKKLHWPEINESLNSFYSKEFVLLNEALKQSTQIFTNYLGISTPLFYSSSQSFMTKKSDLILEICQKYNAKKYLSGPLGRDYLALDTFRKANIEVIFDDYTHPSYDQAIEASFIPYMSIIDLIVNCGKKSLEILNSPTKMR